MRQCEHFIGTMRLHHLGSILRVLLRMTVFSASSLYANAASVQIDSEGPATAMATQDTPPSKGDASPSSSAQSKNRSETKKHGAKAADPESPLEEIVVTGTYIRGVSPASPVITVTSADIENSGVSTAGEVLRKLPESFAGGQQSTIGPNGFRGPFQNLANFNYSDSANLRGFGSDSTLVLINGHRVPVTGIQNSVDTSAVPLPAIERIEVVTDGASALYGSDAVGGVVNFVLKKDYAGAESRAEFGIPTDGGGFSKDTDSFLERPGKADRHSSPINTETSRDSMEVSAIGIPDQILYPSAARSTRIQFFSTPHSKSIRISASSPKDSTIEPHHLGSQLTFPARPTSTGR